MEELKLVWGKWIAVALILGVLAGAVISKAIKLFAGTNLYLTLLANLCVPACVVLGLLYVLWRYQKEQKEVIE